MIAWAVLWTSGKDKQCVQDNGKKLIEINVRVYVFLVFFSRRFFTWTEKKKKSWKCVKKKTYIRYKYEVLRNFYKINFILCVVSNEEEEENKTKQKWWWKNCSSNRKIEFRMCFSLLLLLMPPITNDGSDLRRVTL